MVGERDEKWLYPPALSSLKELKGCAKLASSLREELTGAESGAESGVGESREE